MKVFSRTTSRAAANGSTEANCSTCKGSGKSGKAKLYNANGSVRRVYARTCTACNGTGKAS